MSEATVTTGTVDPAPHRSPTPELHATYTSLELLVAIVAIIGNSMVIHVFRRDRRLRRRTNYYIVSLAIADLLVGLLGIPFAILASVGLPRNLYACLFTTSLLVMLCTISIFCLVAVSVDRYWAILHPMCYSRNVRTQTAIHFIDIRIAIPTFIHLSGVGAPGWRQHPRRQAALLNDRSSVPGLVLYTMNISHITAIFLLIKYANAKINGGPRGRFDKHTQIKPNHHVSAHHAHYSYHPPKEIYFMCRHCSNFATFPVFHGLPPTYVYKYRESGGRFSDLLTGLALYNLGRASTEHWQYTHYYKVRPEEKCSLQVIDPKHFEEVPVPCFIMSSFLERTPESLLPDPNSMDITSPQIDIRPFLYHNGSTLKVTRDQECVLWHNVTLNKEKNILPCSLLKTYSETMKPSGIPVYVWLPSTIALVITIYICCQCCFRKKIKKETQPFNQGVVIGYCTNHY